MRSEIEIIYQDDDIIIVNKPNDMLTIPDRFAADKPSVSRKLTDIYGKIFIVHRLDRETSGILLFARNEHAHREMSMQFEAKTVRKIYYALIDGVLHNEEGEINKPIAEHISVPGRMVIANRGKESLTLYKVIERFKNFTLVEADIRTGRTHQIRIHFTSMGYPLAVDALYGRRDLIHLSEIKHKKFKIGKTEEEQPLMRRNTLHAFRLSINHPVTQEPMVFEAQPPKDFSALLKQLAKWGK
jgi:23S rRNA pseudouridine1911/1915/1917 synthase